MAVAVDESSQYWVGATQSYLDAQGGQLAPRHLRKIRDPLQRAVILTAACHRQREYAPGVPYFYHSYSVARMAMRIGKELQFPPEMQTLVGVIGLGHDWIEESWLRYRGSPQSFAPLVDMSFIRESGFGFLAAVGIMNLTKRRGHDRDMYREQLINPDLELVRGVSPRDNVLGNGLLDSFGFDRSLRVVKQVNPLALIAKVADAASNSDPWKIDKLYELDLQNFAAKQVGSKWDRLADADRNAACERFRRAFEQDTAMRQTKYRDDMFCLSESGRVTWGERDLAREVINESLLELRWHRGITQNLDSHRSDSFVGLNRSLLG